MAGFTLLVPALLSIAAGPRHQQRLDEQLVVEWDRQIVTSDPRTLTFVGNVKATYGPSVLTCDKLTVTMEPGHKHGLAEGRIHLKDPDGTLDASRLFFAWEDRTGSADDVHLESKHLMIHAKHIVLQPKLWTIEDLYATPCAGEKTQLLAIQAPSAVMTPGGDAKIIHPHFILLGKRVLSLKQYAFSSGQPGNGQPLPSLSYSRSTGISGGWQPGLLFDDRTAINAGLHFGQQHHPSEDALLSRSLLAPALAPGGFIPRSDLEERFNFSYFDNVFVPTPDHEAHYVAARRASVSLGTAWNEYPVARKANIAFDKPVELVLEGATPIGGFGLYGQIRGQQIQQVKGLRENRAVLSASLQFPSLTITPGIYTDIRIDGSAFQGQESHYGWTHAQFGLVSRPSRYLRIGAAYETSREFGTAAFVTDRLFMSQSIDMRGDLFLGPTKLSLLGKYDPRAKRWWDSEFQISQVAGCIEPYLIYRQFPRGYGIGIRLRVDEALQALRRRTSHGSERQKEATSR